MRLRLQWFAALAFPLALCPALNAQSYNDEVRLGVEAYRSAHYEEAIGHFRKATELDPSQVAAHMYLATAYVSQYIPGVESPDNLNVAEQAIKQYQQVLDADADRTSKINSTKGIAYLLLNMKKFDEARDYYQKASALDPQDPENYYSIGVIDWTRCYAPRMAARAKLKMAPDENLDVKNAEQRRICERLKVDHDSVIEDGIDNLKRAIELRPDYDDAMAYLNLMYRERADLECEDPVARRKDLKTADEWVDRTMEVKKAKAQRAFPTANQPAEER